MAEKDKPTEPDAAKKAADAADEGNSEEYSLSQLIAAVPQNIQEIRSAVESVVRETISKKFPDLSGVKGSSLAGSLLKSHNGVDSIEFHYSIDSQGGLQDIVARVNNELLVDDEQNEFRKKVFAVLQKPGRQNAQPYQHTNRPAWYRGGHWYHGFMTGSSMESKESDGWIMKTIKKGSKAAKWLIDRVNIRSDKYFLRRK